MMMTELILTLKNRAKTIPYIPENRKDGTVNHGFRFLKGRSEAVAFIPEAQDSEALRYALRTINDESTLFFTVGCEKDLNPSPDGFWVRGYIEFSFNDSDAAAKADSYFRIFCRLNRLVWKSSSDLPVQYHFDIEGADFHQAGRCGFTASVWITTLAFPSTAEAWSHWNGAVRLFADFLAAYEEAPRPVSDG